MCAATSDSLSGTVRDRQDQGVANVRVLVVLEWSGASAEALTAANGAFFQSGLRVSGPFEITFQAPGFHEARITSVMLRPVTIGMS